VSSHPRIDPERRRTGVRDGRIRVGALEMAYDSGGDGSALLLIHGFPHDRTLWIPQLRGLSRQRRVIAPDLRGLGHSEGAPPYTMDRYADDLAAILDALGVKRAIVGGVSMGGYIALALWRRHRALVAGLVLANTRATADDDAVRERRREMIALARSRGVAALADALLSTQLAPATGERYPERVAGIRAMFERAPLAGVVGALEALMARPDSTPTLPTIEVPTLIIHGSADAIAPLDAAREMHSRIAGSRLEVIDGAGHLANAERPAAFNHLVGEFLAAHREV